MNEVPLHLATVSPRCGKHRDERNAESDRLRALGLQQMESNRLRALGLQQMESKRLRALREQQVTSPQVQGRTPC